jgi:hypothetical protein
MDSAYRSPSLPQRLVCHGDGVVVVVDVRHCVACLGETLAGKEAKKASTGTYNSKYGLYRTPERR